MPKFNKDAHVSDKITINGQDYDIRKLYAQAERERSHINLLTKTVKPIGGRPKVKYTLEERVWQVRSTTQEVMARYSLNEQQARAMQWQARNIMVRLDIDPSQT